MDGQHPTRREVLKKAVYTAPVILTLAVTPSFAGTGSGAGPRGGRIGTWQRYTGAQTTHTQKGGTLRRR